MSTTDLAVFAAKLFFVSGTSVVQAWTGASDRGGPVLADCLQAYTAMGVAARTKTLNLLRPILEVTGLGNVEIGLSADYELPSYQPLAGSSSTFGAVWDFSDWDDGDWATESITLRQWASLAAPPFYVAAIGLKSSSSSDSLTWTATDIAFEVGSIL
jgi:hypothetical protein